MLRGATKNYGKTIKQIKMQSHCFLQVLDISQNYKCIFKLTKYTLYVLGNKRALRSIFLLLNTVRNIKVSCKNHLERLM